MPSSSQARSWSLLKWAMIAHCGGQSSCRVRAPLRCPVPWPHHPTAHPRTPLTCAPTCVSPGKRIPHSMSSDLASGQDPVPSGPLVIQAEGKCELPQEKPPHPARLPSAHFSQHQGSLESLKSAHGEALSLLRELVLQGACPILWWGCALLSL